MAHAPPMRPDEIRQAFRSLLLGLFAGLLSSTVIVTALPRVVADLHGGQVAYTWVVAASMAAATLSLPLWGKLADLVSRKALIQLSLGLFALGSALCGLSGGVEQLIVGRVVQGLGAGGVTALTQVIMAALILPRERARYNGRIALVMMVGTVGGPLLGGALAETPWPGWRGCFHLGVVFAVAAALTLQRTLRLPAVERSRPGSRPDLAGAALLTGAAGTFLVTLTLAGHAVPWASWPTAGAACAVIVLAVLFVRTEARAADPLVPLRLLRDRTVALAAVAGFAVGPALFASPALLGQYFQIARGHSPTVSGLLTLPMIAGMLLASTVTGRLISAHGRWKRHVVAGGVLLLLGSALLGGVRAGTPLPVVCAYLFIGGAGVGMTSQNLLLIAQNAVPATELGATTSLVVLSRSLGGVLGVAVLGSLLTARVNALSPATGLGGGLPDPRTLSPSAMESVGAVYGHALGDVFTAAVPFALLLLASVLLLRETPLRTARARKVRRAGAVRPRTGYGPGRHRRR
ncbi:MFS transporter [Actinomadura craniellae]|uniref:MFS transporter n=1 Tax=Actinomadura craniellae TaxID=2231787 RepID=A0A365HBB1_9ACTN|nr:MFS transporter [Actinomadura craniellae]RAY16329.1 MFS transporter [Actinomadura craniellae]